MIEHESYRSAVTRYESEAGDLFKPPSKKRSMYEKGAWLLHDKTGLIAIVNNSGVVFAKGIAAYMQQVAESWAK